MVTISDQTNERDSL